jgi:hypothetical protein
LAEYVAEAQVQLAGHAGWFSRDRGLVVTRVAGIPHSRHGGGPALLIGLTQEGVEGERVLDYPLGIDVGDLAQTLPFDVMELVATQTIDVLPRWVSRG